MYIRVAKLYSFVKNSNSCAVDGPANRKYRLYTKGRILTYSLSEIDIRSSVRTKHTIKTANKKSPPTKLLETSRACLCLTLKHQTRPSSHSCSFDRSQITMAIALLSAIVLILSASALHRIFFSALRDVPGPFLARLTRLWYLIQVHHGHAEKVLKRLHATYGKIVRIGHNQYSLNDPDCLKTIYGPGSRFAKSNFYLALALPGTSTMFTMQDIEQHVETRKKLQPAYTMTAMTGYEQCVDDTMALFIQRLGELAQSGEVVDMTE